MNTAVVVYASDVDDAWMVAVCDNWDDARRIAIEASKAALTEAREFIASTEGEELELPTVFAYRHAPLFMIYSVEKNTPLSGIPEDAELVRWGYPAGSQEYKNIEWEHIHSKWI